MISAWTTSWDGVKSNLVQLQYCQVLPGEDSPYHKKVIVLFELSLPSATDRDVETFFKKVSRHIGSRQYSDTEDNFFQFYAKDETLESIPIIWFWLKSTSSRFAVRHDRAFGQTIVSKVFEHTQIYLTVLRTSRKRLLNAKCAQVKYQKLAYKTLANLFGRNN